jgi:hypothetical protein
VLNEAAGDVYDGEYAAQISECRVRPSAVSLLDGRWPLPSDRSRQEFARWWLCACVHGRRRKRSASSVGYAAARSVIEGGLYSIRVNRCLSHAGGTAQKLAGDSRPPRSHVYWWCP